MRDRKVSSYQVTVAAQGLSGTPGLGLVLGGHLLVKQTSPLADVWLGLT